MKTRYLLAFVALALISVCSIKAGINPALPSNLLKNPSFAEGLQGWEIVRQYPNEPAVDPESDRSVSHDNDNACVRMKAGENFRAKLGQSVVPCPEIRKYRFSAYVMYKDMSPDWTCGIQLSVYKDGRWVRSIAGKSFKCAAMADWTQISAEGELRDEELNSKEKITIQASLYIAVSAKLSNPTADPGDYKKGGMAWFDETVLEPIEEAVKVKMPASAVSERVKIEKFHALGEAGIFMPGETVKLQVEGRNSGDENSEIEVGLQVIDFFGNPVTDKVDKIPVKAKTDFRQVIEIAPPQKKGFFFVKPELREKGTNIPCDVIGFCVIEPVKEKDPFFVGQGANHELIKVLDIIGVAGCPFMTQRYSIPMGYKGTDTDYIKLVMSKSTWGGLAPYWNSSLNLIGYISTESYPKRINEEIKSRKAQGLPPYSEEFYADFGNYVELLAGIQKEKVKIWVLSEEIDLEYMKHPDLSRTVTDERYVRMIKIAYERLKKVDPGCTVIGLTVSGVDSVNITPRFQTLKRLLPRVKDHLDMLGTDSYDNPYDALPDSGPEISQYRASLLETMELQKQLGKSSSIAIAEKGLNVPYHYPLDHENVRCLANLTARDLIITKSVSNVIFYAIHNICLPAGINNQKTPSTDVNPIRDFSLYKQMVGKNGKWYYIPRSAVAAYATVARVLGNAVATDPTEFNLRDDFYCYLFKKKDPAPARFWDLFRERDSSMIAAIWTTNKKGYKVQADLPVAAELCDLMGNSQAYPAGKLELGVSESPVFLTCKTKPKTMVNTIKNLSFPYAPLVKGEAHLADISTVNVYLCNKSNDHLDLTVEADQLKTARLSVLSKTTTLPASAGSVMSFEITGLDIGKSETFNGRIKVRDQVLPVTGELGAISVARLKKEGKIDGDLSKYEGITPLALNGASFLYPMPAEVQNSRQWTGADDLDAFCYLAWDDKYFYIAARVKDDMHLQRQTEASIWKDDCFQFAFDALNNGLSPETTGKRAGSPGYDEDDYNYGLALTTNGPQCYCWVDKGRTDKAGLRNFPLMIKRAGNETIYELAIPWENMAPLVPKAGKAFAFSFLIFDIDNPELTQATYWMGLTKGIAGGQDPGAYKTFLLQQ